MLSEHLVEGVAVLAPLEHFRLAFPLVFEQAEGQPTAVIEVFRIEFGAQGFQSLLADLKFRDSCGV